MSLLVEYSIVDGKAAEQVEALQSFVGALKTLDDGGFDYTAYETDDPTKFIAVLDFDDADAQKNDFWPAKHLLTIATARRVALLRRPRPRISVLSPQRAPRAQI